MKFQKIHFIYLLNIIIIAIVLYLPASGRNGLTIYLFKNIACLICGLGLTGSIIYPNIQKKKDEEKRPIGYKRVLKTVFVVLFSILLFFIGMPGIGNYIKDVGREPVSADLMNWEVTSHRGYRTFITTYKLRSSNGGSSYVFTISGTQKNELERLSNSYSCLNVVYYPNSKVLIGYSDKNFSEMDEYTDMYTDHYPDDNSDSSGNETAESADLSSDMFYVHQEDVLNEQYSMITAINLDTDSLLQDINQNSTLPYDLAKYYGSPLEITAEERKKTNVSIDVSEYDLWGIRIGDDFADADAVMTEKGFFHMAPEKLEEAGYTVPEGSKMDCYIAGDTITLKIFSEIETGKIIEMMIRVD